MLLTTELAQPIVDRAMAILQRNVNIMDGAGVIVGSGDSSRIGSFHEGAAAVLRTGRRVEIQPEDVPNWGGVRMGVNLPLRLSGRIVGVVGITGLPDEVRPFGELIREMVQLMLGQVRTAELERTSALAREALLRDLLTGTDDLSDRAIREAAILGLDEQTPYAVLVGEAPPGAEPGDYAWLGATAALVEQAISDAGVRPVMTTGPWEGRLVVVAGAAAVGLVQQLRGMLAPGVALAAGLPAPGLPGLRRSYRTALLALSAGRRLLGAGAFSADDLHLETLLATVQPEDAAAFVRRVLGGLPPLSATAGMTARETIEVFVRSDLSLSRAAEQLSIHRHTLMYRLEQAASATGFDPRTWDGAVRLYLALVIERLLGQNVQEGAP
ncbi:MAG TPA: sugar diacid recognition domain-containing protein [Symbiobacteriaceae bacterium]|nr:sugar diacid recognition domain-containing protein [Symbiobacteriaceae bacterium]